MFDENFKNYFLNKVGLSNYKVDKIEHSFKDFDGENDITIILSNGNEKISFLIEDKIDAVAMPNQKERYNLRGLKGIEKNLYERFFVFIVAPSDYLKTNSEAIKYENKISYEEILKVLDYDLFAVTLLKKAIIEKEKGYTVIEDKNVTKFWDNYYKYVKNNHPKLQINEIKGPRGQNAGWPQFKTPIKNISVVHKSDRGFIDLTFKGIDNYKLFMEVVKPILEEDMIVVRTGKSISIRVNTEKLSFKESFEDNIEIIKTAFNNIERLICLVEKIDINKIRN